MRKPLKDSDKLLIMQCLVTYGHCISAIEFSRSYIRIKFQKNSDAAAFYGRNRSSQRFLFVLRNDTVDIQLS